MDKEGWHLKTVIIKTPSRGEKWTFDCNKWLDMEKDDQLIERKLDLTTFEEYEEQKHETDRILHENNSLIIENEPNVPWHFWIYTSDIANSNTDAHVTMVMYGDKGKTDEIELKPKKDLFEMSKSNELEIGLKDVGQPFKVRVQHDNSGRTPAWHLDRIEGENMITKEKFIFPCKRWLATDEDDHEIIRELPAEGKNIKSLPIVQYKVEVMTADIRGAGTGKF